MKNIKLIFLFLSFFSISFLYSQGYIYVNPISEDSEPHANHRSNNSILNNLLDEYDVTLYEEAYPGYETPLLQEMYIMKSEGDWIQLMQELENAGLFETIHIDEAQPNSKNNSTYAPNVSDCSDPVEVNDPLSMPGGGNFWVVEELDLDCAWKINNGCEDRIVAFVDTEFETTHDELSGKIMIHPAMPNPGATHGTKTSGIAIARGNNEIGTAGVNPNAKIHGWVTSGGNLWNSIAAAALLDGVRIVNVSWISPSASVDNQAVIREMISRGVIPVFSSGDIGHSNFGWSGISDISGLVFVGGVHKKPWMEGPQWSPSTAHNIDIDILAPSSDYWRPEIGNTIGFYDGPNGNSAATAHVTGVLSLMLCENPCLLPGDVENILSFSGKIVPGMDAFPGEHGAGLISAETALSLVHDKSPFPDVTGNETIDAPINVFSDIRVMDGGTLTITSLVHFNDPNYHVIVEKGGTLILDGAHLRNGCNNDTWGGIKVKGNPNASQYIPAGNIDQGFVQATNSIIENASTAVALSDNFFSDLGGGGICIANGLTVKNCLRGVAMDIYPRKISSLPHQLLPNRTTIRNSNFFIDDDYPFPNSFQINIIIQDVSANTNIINTRIADERTVFTQNIETFGLLVNGSKFNVLGGSEFNNLTYGVKASTINNINNFKIQDSKFDSCFIGVSTRNVPFAMIEDNDFFVGGYQGTTANFDFPDQPTGLILDHSTGFRVEDNTFDGGQGAGLNPLGILSRNTSFGNTLLDFNQINDNTFTMLRSGNLANENNGGNGLLGGLLYKCNQNLGDNEEDITVAFGSVAQNQTFLEGEETGIDNVLSNWDNGNPFSDIDNAIQGGFMRYFYSNGTNFEPLFYPTASVQKIAGPAGCFEDDHCPKCIRLSDPKRDELIGFIQNEDPSFQSDYTIYQGKMDGGNTTGLISDLSSTQNWPTGITNAIGFSPYVSLDVSEVLLQSTIIPIQSKMDVFYANPELVQLNEIWDWIFENVTSSTYTLSQFEQIRTQISVRGQEEIDLESLGRPLIRAATTLIRHYLYQDENTSPDLTAATFYINKYFSAEIEMAAYLQDEDWTKATNLVNNQLQNNSNTELWSFYQLLQTDLQNEDYSLSSAPLVNQANLLIGTNNPSNLQIGRNLLGFIGQGPEFQNEGIFSASQRNAKQENNFTENVERSMLIYPNPAHEETITIHIPNKKTIQGKLKLFNAVGNLVYSSDVNDQFYTLSISGIDSGVYFVKIELEEGDILVEQLIIQ